MYAYDNTQREVRLDLIEQIDMKSAHVEPLLSAFSPEKLTLIMDIHLRWVIYVATGCKNSRCQYE